MYHNVRLVSFSLMHIDCMNVSHILLDQFTVSLIHVINFSFPLISSDEIKCPFFNVVYFKCFIDFNDFRCYFFVHDCILSSQFNTALMQTNYYKDHF